MSGGWYVYRYRVTFEKAFADVRCRMLIKTLSGFELGGRVSAPSRGGLPRVDAGGILEVSFEFRPNLASGIYFINAGVTAVEDGGEIYLDRLLDAVMFRVLPGDRPVVAFVDFSIEPRLRLESSGESKRDDSSMSKRIGTELR